MDLNRLHDHGTVEARQRRLLQTIVDCHPHAGQQLAGDDLRARLIAGIALEGCMREAGGRPAGVRASAFAERQRLGSFLVRAGWRLQGMSGGDLGARPGLKADSATR